MQSTARWFQPSEIEALTRLIVGRLRTSQPAPVEVTTNLRTRQIKATVFTFVMTSLAIGTLIGVLVAFTNPVPGKEPNYPLLVLLCGGLIAGATAITYVVSGGNNIRRIIRDNAIHDFCETGQDLHFAGRQDLDEHAGTIPWLLTEETMGMTGLAVLHSPSSNMVLVECHHIVDPVSSATDSTLLKGAAIYGKQKRMYRRDLEACFFDKELESVPDLVIVPKKDANRGFFKQALKGQHCDVAALNEFPRAFQKKYWVGSADPERCGEILDGPLMELLTNRDWCTVQVVGGRCAVMTAQWVVTQPRMAPNSVESIAANVRFAGTVFDRLRRHEPTFEQEEHSDKYAPSLTSWEAAQEGGVATMPSADAATAVSCDDSQNTKPQSRTEPAVSQPSISLRSLVTRAVLFCLGGVLVLFGGLCAAVTTVDLHNGAATYDWPQTNGTVTICDVDVKQVKRAKGVIEKYRPVIEYEYEVNGQHYVSDRLCYGSVRHAEDRAAIDTFMDDHAVGTEVTVYHRPDKPQDAVLKVGYENPTTPQVARVFFIGVFGLGIFLTSLALRKPKATLPA